MGFLDLSHLEKSFGPTRVVKDFDLSVEQGEFVSLLGPSGCGKTTILRMVAGFEQPSSGSIPIDGQEVTGAAPQPAQHRHGVPGLRALPQPDRGAECRLRPEGAEEARRGDTRPRRGDAAAHRPARPRGRYPFQLSGGQQQRVALARALAPHPRVLLLDEPLSALDAKIRVALREEIKAIQRKLGITTIFVTHDQEEALSISDRIVVMHQGIADQVGTPFEIYNHPSTRFVA